MTQLALPLTDAPARPLPPRFAAFVQFHREHPHVYAALARYAKQAKASGRERLGLRMLAERVRWYFTYEFSSGDEWKLNNNHLPYYSRLLMLLEPELAGMFAVRAARSDASDTMLLEHCQ